MTNEDANSLLLYTEGWAIALQLIWQNLRNQPVPSLDFPSHWQAASLEALFDLLAREVFAGQSADVREFLLITSTLRDLMPEVCDALRRAVGNPVGDSASMLAYLRRQDLFIVQTAEGVMRYHHIFHNFLRQQSSFEQRQRWNRIVADYFSSRNDPDSVIFHLLEARAWDAVADRLDEYSGNLLSVGRLDTLAIYIDSLPPETLHGHPMLVFTLGELARLHSRFDESLGWYKQAETIWRNRGQQDGIARSLPSAIGFIVGSNIAPRFIYRFPPASVLGYTLALAAVGLAVLTQVGGSIGLVIVVIASVVISLALAPVFSLTTELIVGSAPPERAGAASGISETGAELGGALGIAILGSIGTAVYRSALTNRLPAGVPSAAAEVARDTLGAAVNVAKQLPDAVGLALLNLARDAFIQGLHLAAAISAVVAIGAAIMVVTLLRSVPTPSETNEHPDLASAAQCGADD